MFSFCNRKGAWKYHVPRVVPVWLFSALYSACAELEAGRRGAASKCESSGTHPVASLKTLDKGIVRVILYHLECGLRSGCGRREENAVYLVPPSLSEQRVSFWTIVLIPLAYSKSSLTSGTGRQPDRQTDRQTARFFSRTFPEFPAHINNGHHGQLPYWHLCLAAHGRLNFHSDDGRSKKQGGQLVVQINSMAKRKSQTVKKYYVRKLSTATVSNFNCKEQLRTFHLQT